MTDKERQYLIAEIERLKDCASPIVVCDTLLSLIDSMQEEPVSGDLEIAAKEWDAKASFTPFYMVLDDNGNPYEVRQDYTTHAESFKAGAEWQKQQMMANAADMVVGYWMPNGLMLTVDEAENCYNIDEGDRVKVIVIKED